MLDAIKLQPREVQDIYFTGALTDPSKTDFYVEYLAEDDRWRRYTPDFIIRRKDGRCLIVEIKDARFKAATDQDIANHALGGAAVTTEGRKAIALKKWENLNPDRLKYQIIFADGDVIPYNTLNKARACAGDARQGLIALPSRGGNPGSSSRCRARSSSETRRGS